jgi:hypothetical protein
VLILCLVFSTFIIYLYVFLVCICLLFIYINFRVHFLKTMFFLRCLVYYQVLLSQPSYVHGFLDFQLTTVFIFFLELLVRMFLAIFSLDYFSTVSFSLLHTIQTTIIYSLCGYIQTQALFHFKFRNKLSLRSQPYTKHNNIAR